MLWEIIFLTGFLYTSSGGRIISLCNSDCTTEKVLLYDDDDFEFQACEGHLVQLVFLPDKETDAWILLKDTETDRKLFYKNGFDSNDDIEELSSSNRVTLSHNFNANNFQGFDIRYSCKPNITQEETIQYGEGHRTIGVDANQIITYNLESVENHLNVDLKLEFPSPIAGFAAVDIGDGMYAIGFQQFNLSLENSEERGSQIVILTSNTVMPGGVVTMGYDLGENKSVTTTTPDPDTTTTPPVEKITTVYILSVMENVFVDNYLDEFKERTWKIMTDVCKVSEPGNAIHYSSAFSCRQLCSMSSQTERGCVMIEMHLENIPTSTYCNYTEDLSRTEYFKSQLREISGEMRRDYKAGRVSVDTCNHIGWTTQWVWVSVGLVAGVILLSILIMFTKRRLTRGTPRRLDSVSGEDNDKDKLTAKRPRYNDAFDFEEQ